MTYENALLAISIHLLIWEHLPHWGTWFNKGLSLLPAPLQTLYEQWRCPYCAGFWIALAVHGMTGHYTFTLFGALPPEMGVVAAPLGWFFDALATALLVKAGVLAINALTYPAIQGHKAKTEFLASMATKKT